MKRRWLGVEGSRLRSCLRRIAATFSTSARIACLNPADTQLTPCIWDAPKGNLRSIAEGILISLNPRVSIPDYRSKDMEPSYRPYKVSLSREITLQGAWIPSLYE